MGEFFFGIEEVVGPIPTGSFIKKKEIMYKKDAIIAEFLYDLKRVEVKAKSLPNKYMGKDDSSFPREDSYLLVNKKGNSIFWVPGYVNDCYIETSECGSYENHIKMPPHFFDDESRSREMEKLIFEKGLHLKYIKELESVLKNKHEPLEALMIASCSQRAEALLGVINGR